MPEGRFHRQELLFGPDGQASLSSCHVAVVGLGGLGSHIGQQLAYLGVRSFLLIDADTVSHSNLNRLIGATPGDAETGSPKVRVVARTIRNISPDAGIDQIFESFISEEGFARLRETDFIFGCVDNDASRLILNELCQAYERPYLDIATDINPDDKTFGGRIVFADGQVCVSCKDVLDQQAIRNALSSDGQREEDKRIYGIRSAALGAVGPAVVSLNGILASTAVTEFMVEVTGIRPAALYLEYNGPRAILTKDPTIPTFSCYYCHTLRATGARADVERYIREGWGKKIFVQHEREEQL